MKISDLIVIGVIGMLTLPLISMFLCIFATWIIGFAV